MDESKIKERIQVKRWFMVHTYSGYEKKVKSELEQKIEAHGITNLVTSVLVPEEITSELVRGKRKTVARKLYPGYVMIEMIVTQEIGDTEIYYKVDSEAWFIIRNTAGVTGFVGVGSDPIPMEDSEVKNIFRITGMDLPEHMREHKEVVDIDYAIGDTVKILAGGFMGSEGKVSALDMAQQKVTVMVEMFGRMTPVEVPFDDAEKA